MNHKKLLLTLTLCLCALLCMVVTASASEVQEHSHPVCGKTHTDIGDHTGTCGDVTWTAWNGPAANGDTNITYDSNNTAYIYLADNVNISNKLTIPQGHTLYLCLNGHSITKTSEDFGESNSQIYANGVIDGSAGNVTFALCNCKTDGTITHTSGKNGRGVWVKGTFIMYGGAISGNNCVHGEGGGAFVDGAFIMYGGTIKENKLTSTYSGGGVAADCSTFAMYGGIITGNEATNKMGGGLSLNMGSIDNEVKAIISGGTITNNKAADMGGGVHIANGTLTLSGNTTITGNTCGADSHGGGVSTYQATIELASKDVTIENNKNGSGAQANLYLRSKASYTEPSYISVTGDLGSKVFTLTTEKTPTVGNPVTISPYPYCDAGVLNAQNFKYENNDQVSIAVIPTGGKECLKACIHSFTKTSTASKYLKSSATCTSEAVYYKSCACGLASSTETFTSGAIDPENHALVHHEAQAPTCTAVGWEAYDTCSRCTYTTYREIPAAHTYGAVSYTWATDKTTCKAEHKCTACQHVENETVNTQKQVTQNRSCTRNELSTFTATFTNTAFAQQIKENVETADMTGHTYGAVSYTWATDKTTCKAEHKCTACQHVENETVNTQKQVTQNRSCTRNELSTFTATFTNTAFAQQIKENVETADMTGHTYGAVSYTWATDKTTCKAEHKCTACQHVENETVNTQKQVTQNRSCTRNELSTFTATFTNTAFVRQTEENVKTADMAPHTYGGTWVKGQDGHWKVCEVCQNQSEVKPHTWKDATYTAPKTCTVCGATQGEPLTRSYYYYAPSVAENKKDSPKTADPGVLLYAGLALASLTGLACTAKKRH